MVAAGLLTGCTSSGEPPGPTASAAAPSPVPSVTVSMSPEIVAACTHVRTAFAAQAVRDWKAVLAELTAAWRAGHESSDHQFAGLLAPPDALRLDDPQTLGKVTDTLTFACGFPSRPSPNSSPAAPSRREVQVSLAAVDGVRMGTPAAEAERRLRQSLGDADSQPLPGCNGETGRTLTWGSFTVVLSDEGKGPVVLRGWTLRSGISRVTYRLPYDVQPGDTMREVLDRVPGAVGVPGEGEFDDRHLLVHTDRAPDVLWISDEKGRAGKVEEISLRGVGCD
jgi:hypothetical protein